MRLARLICFLLLGVNLAPGQAVINGARVMPEISAPSNPAANSLAVYACDDAGTTKLCSKDSAGTVSMGLGGGGGAGVTVTESVFASIPGSPAEGDVWLQDPDEGPLSAVFDGTNWKYSGFGLNNISLPATTGWSLTYGTATDTAPFTPTTTGGFIKLALAASSGTFFHVYRRNVPSDPTVKPYFLEMCVSLPMGPVIAGVGFFDDTGGDDGTIAGFNRTGGAYETFVARYDFPSAGAIALLVQLNSLIDRTMCYGLREDATTRYVYEGTSPANLQLVHSEGRTTTYTATDVAVVLFSNNIAFPLEMDIFHYRVR